MTKLRIVALAFLMLLLVAIGLVALDLYGLSKYTEDHEVTCTLGYMHTFMVDITILLEKGYRNPISFNDIVEWYEQTDISGMLDNHYEFDKTKGEVYDSWGNPIHIKYSEPDLYTFTSYGPNKKDQHGKRDDIVLTYKINGYDFELVEIK